MQMSVAGSKRSMVSDVEEVSPSAAQGKKNKSTARPG
jgi:hypothetical protein